MSLSRSASLLRKQLRLGCQLPGLSAFYGHDDCNLLVAAIFSSMIRAPSHSTPEARAPLCQLRRNPDASHSDKKTANVCASETRLRVDSELHDQQANSKSRSFASTAKLAPTINGPCRGGDASGDGGCIPVGFQEERTEERRRESCSERRVLCQ